MTIKYLGQSCFSIEMNDKHLVFDPFISYNPLANHIKVDEVKADYILISHAHNDHIADASQIAKNNNSKFISSYEVVNEFEKQGYEGHGLNIGGKWKFDFGNLKLVNAIHSSSFSNGNYGGACSGFVIWDDKTSFYFAGDTALTYDMKLIPMTCPKLDFAILPIGDNFTMGMDDAVIASQFIECDTIIACHFDTFGLIKIDHQAALSAFEKVGKKLIIPTIGEKIKL